MTKNCIIYNIRYLEEIAFSAEYGGMHESHLDSGSFLKLFERIKRNILFASVTPPWSLAKILARGVSRYENLYIIYTQ